MYYSNLTRVWVLLLIIITVTSLREAFTNNIGYYTIVAPGTIRSESVFHVSITLNDFHRSCWFSISLMNFNQTVKLLRYEGIKIRPRTTQLVKLRAPYLIDKLGHLEVFGYRGIRSRDSAVINFEANSYSTFIQVNKAKFRPSELVEFRVICVDQLTRPAIVTHKIFVKICDGQDNLLKLVYDVELVQGVFRGEFQLSDNPVLGVWQIQVEIDGDVVAEKSFEVARYVLPKFAVEIQTKPNVAIDEGHITLGISSSNFYGEPVRGNLTISLRKTYAYFQENIPTFKRSSQINGYETIILDIENDLHLKNKIQDRRCLTLYKFKVEAHLIDELTEQQFRTEEVEIIVHSQPYKIKLQAPEVFAPDEIITKVSLSDLQDNPIKDLQDPIKMFLECKRYKTVYVKPQYEFHIGTDYSILKIINENFTNCHLHAAYRGSKSAVRKVIKNVDLFYLDILTESPEVGKELAVRLKSLEPIGHFSYEIVSRGDIIKSQLIYVPDNQTSYILRFPVTFLMVPKITIYIHGIKDRSFIGLLKDVYIKRAFENSIRITAPEETRPASAVNINVTTDEGSYVGLMGIDHRILQSTPDEDDMTEDNFYTKLRNYDSISFETSGYDAGLRAGLLTFTNAKMPIRILAGWGCDDEAKCFARGDSGGFQPPPRSVGRPTIEFPYVRKFFTESWLYRDFQRTPAKGLRFIETIPDTITTWCITGFSLNIKTGLTLTKNPTNLKVFQEFFISMYLPIVVREDEVIEVPIYIRHSMSQDVRTNVTISSDSEYLEVLEHPAAKSKKNLSKITIAGKLEKIVFYIRPRKPGKYNVMAKAISAMASDAVQKTLEVQPQGIPYEMSNTYLVHLPEGGIQEHEIRIDIPENAVPESQRVEISVVGDVFRPLLRSIQKMERVPYGNGEENMKFIVSNLLVLKYLKALNYSKPCLENKIKLNLELGYQNQLSFKHLDGSFGLFERTVERTGNVWQTAFAIWGLKQAADFIQIDFRVIKRGLEYLSTQQQEHDGCFKLFNKSLQEDVKNTAFVLMVFLMDNYSKTAFREVISKGLQCLYARSESLEQSSDSLLSMYVLLLAKHEAAEDRLKKLTNSSRSSTRRKRMLWTRPDTLESNLETTAESIVNIFESQIQTLGQSSSMLRIAKELFNLETGDSSINHLIALKELVRFIENLRFDRSNLNISFRDDQKGIGEFRMNSENTQVLQILKISRRSRKINVQTRGLGFAIMSLNYKYNLVPETQYFPDLISNITTLIPGMARSLKVLEFCASILTTKSENDLIVMEIALPSGYVFSGISSLEVDLKKTSVKSIQRNGNKDMIVVYFEGFYSNGECLRLKTFREYKVLNVKPGWVIMYDAHKKNLKTFKSFTIDGS